MKDLIEAHLKDPGRPSPDKTQPRPPPNIKHRAFPEAVDTVPLTKAWVKLLSLDFHDGNRMLSLMRGLKI